MKYYDVMGERSRIRTLVASPEQRAVLTSPFRLEIMGWFGQGQQLSVRELARHLERPAASLYFHLRKLVEVGLLKEVARRSTGTREAAVYAAAAERIALPVDPCSKSSTRAAVRTVSALLRQADREFRVALEHGALDQGSPEEAQRGRRQRAWLNEAAVAEVGRRLRSLETYMERQTRKKEGREYAWTSLLVPLARRRSR